VKAVRRVGKTQPAALSAFTLLVFLISSVSGSIVINEVELNPAGDDNSPYVLEWVELYNTGNEDVDISSWTLVAAHGDKEVVRIPSGATIEAKGFYAIPDHPPKEQWLDNRDESVILKNSSGVEIDRTLTLEDDRGDSCAWSRYPDGSPDWGFMISSKGFRASGDFCHFAKDDDALSCCFGEYDGGSLWNVSCLNVGDKTYNCLIEDPFIESEECEISNDYESWIEWELNESADGSDLKFEMGQEVLGAGFINLDNRYYSTPMGDFTGIELNTREHGSGSYNSTEQIGLLREDKSIKLNNTYLKVENASIEMNKDVSANYTSTTLGLPYNRSVTYSSKWTEEACAKTRINPPLVGSKESNVYHYPWCWHVKTIKPENLKWFSSLEDAKDEGRRACEDCITESTICESYRYITSIDRKSHVKQDQKESVFKIDSGFEGTGYIGFLKKSDPGDPLQETPKFESREDYTGSFQVLEKIEDCGSGATSEKSMSGAGFVSVDKRIRESQRTYESGTGAYETEEIIKTRNNYVAKDLNVTHSQTNQTQIGNVTFYSSLRWKEGVWSQVKNMSFVGEEYTGADHLDKETEVRGLNEIETEANFSGKARYRTILRKEVDQDEQYEGDYSVHRRTIFTGVPKYDRPHLNVTKTGEIDLVNRSERSSIVCYTITLENDGNRALGPVYVKDIFPSGARFIDSSMRPSELTAVSANWTLTHLAIGDTSSITLLLDVANCPDGELVNRAKASGGYNGDYWITGDSSCIIKRDER